MHKPFRPIAFTAALGVLMSLAAIVPADAATPASTTTVAPRAAAKVALTPANPIAGERVAWVVKTKMKRAKIIAQVAKGSTWKNVAKAKTNTKGVATVRLKAKAGKYRLVSGKKVVATKRIKTTQQTGTLTAPGSAVRDQPLAMHAEFTPARTGRGVALQILHNGTWSTLSEIKQDGTGRADFAITPYIDGALAYRAVAKTHNGAPAAVSTTRTVNVTAAPKPTPTPEPSPTGSPTPGPTPTPMPEMMLPPVVSLDATILDTLDAYDKASGEMRFDTGAPAAIRSAEPGTIIAVPVTDRAPDGALREVISTTSNPDGSVTLQTGEGVLAEAVAATPDEARDVKMQHASTEVLGLADGVRMTTPDANARRSAARAPKIGAAAGEYNEYNLGTFTLTIDPHDVDLGNGAEAEVLGEVAVTPTADLHLDIGDVSLDWRGLHVDVNSYKLGAGAEIESELDIMLVKELAEYETEKRWELAKLQHRFRAFIGPVLVWVKVVQAFVLDIDIEGEVGVKVTTTYMGRVVGGVQKEQGSSKVVDPYFDTGRFDTNVRAGLLGKAEVFVGFAFVSHLYDAGGPEATFGVQATAEGEIGVPVVGGEWKNAIPFTDGFSWRNVDWDFASCKVEVGPAGQVDIALADAIEKLIGQKVNAELWVSSLEPWWKYECPDPNDTPRIKNGSLPDTSTGADYEVSLRTEDDREGDWTVVDGDLPAGLVLGDDTVVGKPTYPGYYSFAVRFMDETGRTDTRRFNVSVTGEPIDPTPGDANWLVVDDNVGDGHLYRPYLTELRVDPRSPFAGRDTQFEVVGGELPPGMRVQPGGVLSGTPTATGTYRFRVKASVTDGAFHLLASGSRRFTVVVVDDVPYRLPNASTGQVFRFDLAALYDGDGDGGHTWEDWGWLNLNDGLPRGLSVLPGSMTGGKELWGISGTPETPGEYVATLQMRDGSRVRRYEFALHVDNDPLAFQRLAGEEAMQDAHEGVPYSFRLLEGSRSSNAFDWDLIGSLPPGISIEYDGDLLLTGTPDTPGTYTFRITHNYPGKTYGDSENYSLTVVAGDAEALTIPGDLFPDAVESDRTGDGGVTYFVGLPRWPDKDVQWRVFGQMPPGIGYSDSWFMWHKPAFGGSPQLEGTYTFTITATTEDGRAHGSRGFTVVIHPPGSDPDQVGSAVP